MRLRLPLVGLMVFAALLNGCARQADVSKTKHYADRGVSFDYPGNWRIAETKELSIARLLVLKEPGNAVMLLTVYNPGVSVSLPDYSKKFSESLQKSIPFGIFKELGATDVHEPEGERIDLKCMLKMAIVDLPYTVNVRKRVLDGFTLITVTQVPDEKRALVAAGFDLVHRTLRCSSTTSQP
jgi:hypothetical protein